MTLEAIRSWRGTPVSFLIAASVVGTALMVTLGGKAALLALMSGIESHKALVIAGFAVWALAANCLVLPAGSVSLMAGGAILGVPVPAAIWFAAQLATAPFLYRAAGRGQSARFEKLVQRYLGPAAAVTLTRAAEAGIATTIVLRLTPVLPSAPAAIIASWAGIRFRSFLIGSLLAGWVRPLYFASLGAAAGSLAGLTAASEALSLTALAPLALTFGCAAIALVLRLRFSRPPDVVTVPPAPAPPG